MGHKEMRLPLWDPAALSTGTGMSGGQYGRKTTTNIFRQDHQGSDPSRIMVQATSQCKESLPTEVLAEGKVNTE